MSKRPPFSMLAAGAAPRTQAVLASTVAHEGEGEAQPVADLQRRVEAAVGASAGKAFCTCDLDRPTLSVAKPGHGQLDPGGASGGYSLPGSQLDFWCVHVGGGSRMGRRSIMHSHPDRLQLKNIMRMCCLEVRCALADVVLCTSPSSWLQADLAAHAIMNLMVPALRCSYAVPNDLASCGGCWFGHGVGRRCDHGTISGKTNEGELLPLDLPCAWRCRLLCWQCSLVRLCR